MFPSADSALRWAAKIKCTLIIDGSSVNDMCGKPTPGTTNDLLRGLSAQEAQQQADTIIKYATSISDSVCVQYIQAKYFFQTKVDDIVQRVMSNVLHAMGGTNRRDIHCVVRAYVGDTVTKRQMREALRCRSSTVAKIESQVYDAMDGVHYQAMNGLESKLKDMGLISLDK